MIIIPDQQKANYALEILVLTMPDHPVHNNWAKMITQKAKDDWDMTALGTYIIYFSNIKYTNYV